MEHKRCFSQLLFLFLDIYDSDSSAGAVSRISRHRTTTRDGPRVTISTTETRETDNETNVTTEITESSTGAEGK